MEITPKYDPGQIEDKWYQSWQDNGYFRSIPDDREPYCVVIPPPNVTGVLHMGHMLNNTIQDVLVRRARMMGKNACWVPGTDHASIATEAKVVKMLADKGINKKDLSREEFLAYAWEWKEKYGGIILEQLKKLGASCDWDRTRFTMEQDLYDSVIEVFIDLYNKNLIYRGTKMVNWDPAGKTTLSDEEVLFKQVQDKLYYVKYKLVDSNEFLEVATARPETIAGDVAICVHPADARYLHLIGKKVLVPLINREVEIIADDYIDIEFGTGILKVTPAHDIHDYEIGLKFNLPVYDTLNDDGTISEAGIRYIGKDRFVARKLWVKDLEEAGLLSKTEDYTHNVGCSERTDAVVEPKISTQWFVDMQKFMKRNPEVLDSVMSDKIKFYPAKFKNTYSHWIENIKDWNISRQLWWGQRIPAWYNANGQFEVAKNAEIAAQQFASKGINVLINELKQDEDVLDTWFSSWLWPISVFDGFKDPNNKDINYYYPTNDLVTAPEIIFFWVARMIMAGYEYKKELPFKSVYFTGIVRDKQKRKMSKSLGNSPDPLDLIAKHGADAVRMGMLLCSPAGNDILFDESQVEQGRNFCNKLWNAYRLIQSWQLEEGLEARENESIAAKWYGGRINAATKEIDACFQTYRLNEALMIVYKLFWDDFCSVYLEAIKPPYGENASKKTVDVTSDLMDQSLALLHPFMPFITEELHHALFKGSPNKMLIVSEYPKWTPMPQILLDPIAIVTEIRNIRNSKGISPKLMLTIFLKQEKPALNEFNAMLEKLCNATIKFENRPDYGNYLSSMVGTTEVFVEWEEEVDIEAETKVILEEIGYLNGFLIGVNAKLSNERFVANAKEDILKREKQKKADAEMKLDILQKRLAQLR